jgi:hypothetical protein
METLAYLHLSLWYETASRPSQFEAPRTSQSNNAEQSLLKKHGCVERSAVNQWQLLQPGNAVYVLMP